MTPKEIEEKGLILYRYIKGSQAHGTSIETSDIDEGGIYILPNETLLGLGDNYIDEVSDEKHDLCWWEIKKFMRLLLSSNPTVLESLFVPEDKVIYEHPIITEIKKHREKFITKACFKPFGHNAAAQIKKSQGTEKKIHWDILQMTRKTPLDFCFTFDDKQGSINIQDWLKERGLDQRNCGLVNIPNMPGVFRVYYDFGQHIRLTGITEEYFCDEKNIYDEDNKFIQYVYRTQTSSWFREEMRYDFTMGKCWEKISTPIGKHNGIINPEGNSNEIRFSETKKNSSPICFMTYNENGYRQHCKKYKEYIDWKEHRNKARYENNLEGKEKEDVSKFYDAKNMMHCFRLISMCTEIARGEGIKIDRREIDAPFLIDIRRRKYTYEELMEKLEKMKEIMDQEIEKSTIPDEVSVDLVNNLLLTARKQFWKTYEKERGARS